MCKQLVMNCLKYNIVIVDEDNAEELSSTFDILDHPPVNLEQPDDFFSKLNLWSMMFSSRFTFYNSYRPIYFLFYVNENPSRKWYINELSPYIQERLNGHTHVHQILHEMDLILFDFFTRF